MGYVNDGSGGTTSARFVASVIAVCLIVFVATARQALPGSTMPRQVLTETQLRALAHQATLRVAASACGGVTRGSGVIVEGRLVTNAHVVARASDIKADQPIDPVLVPLVAVDVGSDLAIAEQPAGVSLILAPAGAVQADVVGRPVVVAGHAGGGSIEVQNGTITGRVPGGAYGYRDDILLIDVPTRGGYSGGPVLDEAGDLVAVLSGFDRSTGLTLAIPADVIESFLEAHQGRDATGFDDEASTRCG